MGKAYMNIIGMYINIYFSYNNTYSSLHKVLKWKWNVYIALH